MFPRSCSMAALSLLAAIVLWPAAAAALDESDQRRPLRVMTFNLLHDGPGSGFVQGNTRLEERLEMAIRELKALDPDILAVQEASDSRRHGNVPERLAAALGLEFVFAPATEHIFGFAPLDRAIVGLMGFKEGPAILTRFPILASEVYALPRCQSRLEPRVLLRADLRTDRGPLQIFTTHTARGDECQMERVGEIVRERTGNSPSLLMGDFNTGETSKVLSTLRREGGFVDAFRSANPTIEGPTVWQRIESPQPTVSRRVDFVLILNGRDVQTAVRSSRVVLDRPGRLPDGTALWPSDHYGVFAELELIPISLAETGPHRMIHR